MNAVSTTIPGAFKKNGTLHLRNCAAFYNVQPHTLRVWQRAGAPLLDPEAMVVWKENRNRNRLQKIGNKNTRHADKRAEIVRLYVDERLGLRAISRYFGARPTTAGVRAILIAAGVYRGEAIMAKQAARSLARQKVIVAAEKENRRRIATCLWRLRGGQPVETTCRANGWNPKSIWNALGRRASYMKLKTRLKRRWPDKRQYGRQYSRVFAREEQFQIQIEGLLRSAAINYVKECQLQRCRTRVDLKIADGTFVECKVGMNSGQTYEFIGQACHYRLFTHRVILCIPSDIEIRADLYELIVAQGVTVCSENTLVSALDCASSIPGMT